MDSKLQQQIYQYAETLPAERKAILKMANPEMLYSLYIKDLEKYGTKEQKEYADKILPSLRESNKKDVGKSSQALNTGNVWNGETKLQKTSALLVTNTNTESEFSSKTSFASTLSPSVQKSIRTELQKKSKELEKKLTKAKDENGFIGSSWDWIKNKTTIGAGSDKTQKEIEALKTQLEDLDKNPKNLDKVYKNITGKDLNKEEFEKFKKGEISLKASDSLKSYKEGQEMAVDVASDLVSGVASVGIYTAAVAAAPFTGGASIAAGVLAAGAAGAAIKTGIKYADAKSGGREYNSLGYDLGTGAFSGVLAPITGGVGGAAGKAIATRLGVQAVKQAGKEVIEEVAENTVKQGIKTALINPSGYEYVGGTFLKRTLATGTEMAVGGSTAGSVDNMFRASLNGDNIVDAGVQGFVGGLVLSPFIGGGFKVAGKTGSKLFKSANEEINSKSITDNISEELGLAKASEQRALPAHTEFEAQKTEKFYQGKKLEDFKHYSKIIEGKGNIEFDKAYYEIKNVLPKEMQQNLKQISKNEESIALVGRPKSKESTYDKIVDDADRKNITDIKTAFEAVDDLEGIRLVLDDTSPQEINKLVNSLHDGILKGDIVITEIRNYRGKFGSEYFSDEQIEKLQKAVAKRYDAAKEGPQKLAVKEAKKEIKDSGYTTTQMKVIHKGNDGKPVLGEFQIRGKYINDFAEVEHIPYDLRTGKDLSKGVKEIGEVYEPFKKAIKALDETQYEEYNHYLSAIYKYYRNIENGNPNAPIKMVLENGKVIEYPSGQRPQLPEGFDPILSEDSMHKIAKEVKTTKKNLEAHI